MALIIFIFTVFVYFGIIFGYNPYLKSKTRTLEQKLSILNQSMDENQQKQIITFFSQMTNIQKLLSDYKIYSSIFDFIEKNTYQPIIYSNLKFNVAEMEVKIEGTAPNYEYLVKELALLNKAPEVKAAYIENSVAQELKDVKFSIRLALDRQFLKQQQVNQTEQNAEQNMESTATSTPQKQQ